MPRMWLVIRMHFQHRKQGEGLKMNLYSQQVSGETTYKSLLATAKVPVQKNDPTSKILERVPV